MAGAKQLIIVVMPDRIVAQLCLDFLDANLDPALIDAIVWREVADGE